MSAVSDKDQLSPEDKFRQSCIQAYDFARQQVEIVPNRLGWAEQDMNPPALNFTEKFLGDSIAAIRYRAMRVKLAGDSQAVNKLDQALVRQIASWRVVSDDSTNVREFFRSICIDLSAGTQLLIRLPEAGLKVVRHTVQQAKNVLPKALVEKVTNNAGESLKKLCFDFQECQGLRHLLMYHRDPAVRRHSLLLAWRPKVPELIDRIKAIRVKAGGYDLAYYTRLAQTAVAYRVAECSALASIVATYLMCQSGNELNGLQGANIHIVTANSSDSLLPQGHVFVRVVNSQGAGFVIDPWVGVADYEANLGAFTAHYTDQSVKLTVPVGQLSDRSLASLFPTLDSRAKPAPLSALAYDIWDEVKMFISTAWFGNDSSGVSTDRFYREILCGKADDSVWVHFRSLPPIEKLLILSLASDAYRDGKQPNQLFKHLLANMQAHDLQVKQWLEKTPDLLDLDWREQIESTGIAVQAVMPSTHSVLGAGGGGGEPAAASTEVKQTEPATTAP